MATADRHNPDDAGAGIVLAIAGLLFSGIVLMIIGAVTLFQWLEDWRW